MQLDNWQYSTYIHTLKVWKMSEPFNALNLDICHPQNSHPLQKIKSFQLILFEFFMRLIVESSLINLLSRMSMISYLLSASWNEHDHYKVINYMYCKIILIRGANVHGSWNFCGFLGGIISWVTGFLNHNARQFIILLNIPGNAIIRG